MEPNWPLIDELAAAIGVGQPARAKWRKIGVPRMYHLLLLDEAARRGRFVTRAMLGIPAVAEPNGKRK